MNHIVKRIRNAVLVLPDRLFQGDLLLEDGRIREIVDEPVGAPGSAEEGVVNAEGCYVIPGLIDMHSDAIEKEMQPRPNTLFPLRMSFFDLEKKLAGGGITTMFHSLSLTGGTGLRDNETMANTVKAIAALAEERYMIRHRVHVRYELTNLDGLPIVHRLLDQHVVGLLSLMDHTPGQGQFSQPGAYENYMMRSYGIQGKEADDMVARLRQKQQLIDWRAVAELARKAADSGIPIASHDDDSIERAESMKRLGVTIHEFPISLEVAAYCAHAGYSVCVGAPNIVRGMSHSHNLSAMEAIEARAATMICSDYLPTALLPAVWKAAEAIGSLPQAVRYATLHPAEALRLSDDYGSIEVGKMADLVVVAVEADFPRVKRTIVGGQLVYEVNDAITCAREAIRIE